MGQDATCAFCDQPADAVCKRCGRPYCGLHGDPLCFACLDPLTAAPSARHFRLSLIGLVVCLALGLGFLAGGSQFPGEGRTARAKASSSVRGISRSPVSVPPTATAPAGTPTPTPTALATRDYTVQAGDTLQSIAAAAGVSTATVQQLNPSVDPTNLQVGQVIRLPTQPP